MLTDNAEKPNLSVIQADKAFSQDESINNFYQLKQEINKPQAQWSANHLLLRRPTHRKKQSASHKSLSKEIGKS